MTISSICTVTPSPAVTARSSLSSCRHRLTVTIAATMPTAQASTPMKALKKPSRLRRGRIATSTANPW